MKWGVQQVSVTLESDSGETLVVEQRPDGKVVCKPVPKDMAAAKPDKPATKPDKPAAKPRAPRKPKADKPPTRAPKATKAPEPKAKPEPKPADDKAAAKQPRAAQAREPLDWHTIDDHGYTGIGALAKWGAYKALRAKTAATYALFFETANQPPHHIGCFRTLDEVKKRAQQIHDSGWPPFVGVTKADVEGACPAPSATPTAEPKPSRARKPKGAKAPAPEAQPAAPTTEARPEPAPQPAAEPSPAGATADTSQDEELMRSLSAALAANLPDEDD